MFDVTRVLIEGRTSPAGRVTGTVSLPDEAEPQPFEGWLELVGLIEAALAGTEGREASGGIGTHA